MSYLSKLKSHEKLQLSKAWLEKFEFIEHAIGLYVLDINLNDLGCTEIESALISLPEKLNRGALTIR